ncbi:HlyD family secretion protein [Pseudooceanicola sp. LIPI14-2-Ac024]|uniref:HlyD family secretion protein n=1 Tax=Pseudooceanicola sp. LIPI14-2-Ac024 TaxID=3344875 RepID=UPI0035CEC5CF
MAQSNRRWIVIGVVVVAAIALLILWNRLSNPGLPDGIASGNGRIEATEIDIAALSGGRIQEILAVEGAFVTAGDPLVQMDTTLLASQKKQAEAALARAQVGISTADSLVAQAEAQKASAEAAVEQAQAGADAAASQVARSESLAASNTISQQVLDADIATNREAQAGVTAAQASLAAAEAGVGSAKAQVIDATAAVESARAQVDYIATQIADSTLTSPRDGRVQFLVARDGEVVGAGSRILSLVDLADVYMTFFLPTAEAGRLAVGSEARLVLDAAPAFVLPAEISFVADVAQFTPKTVEAPDEREKLMFRVRARVSAELLEKYIQYVKTGLPGDAYVKIDPEAEWPSFLDNVVE